MLFQLVRTAEITELGNQFGITTVCNPINQTETVISINIHKWFE